MSKVKVIRITPDQAARYWPVLSAGFASSFPPASIGNEITLNNMLTAITHRHMDCWIVKAERDGKERMIAAACTILTADAIAGHKNLLIYSLFSARGDVTDEEWGEAFNVLKAAARSYECHKITAYTKNLRIMELVKKVGGNTDWRAIEIEVNQ